MCDRHRLSRIPSTSRRSPKRLGPTCGCVARGALLIWLGAGITGCDSAAPPAAKPQAAGNAGSAADSEEPSAASYLNPPPPQGIPKGMPGMIALDHRELDLKGINMGKLQMFPTGILVRELARQSLLLAARDELGLTTRDSTLREDISLSDNPGAYPVSLLTKLAADRNLSIEVSGFTSRGKSVKMETRLWTVPESNWIVPLVEMLEPLSRAEFPEFCKKLGHSGQANRPVASGPLAESTERLLTQMDFISQFAAIRELHAAIRRDGESPQRLGALARGYANLGSLTEYNWSPAHKAFKARALLYAERLVAREKRSPLALWNRAYVRAIVGLHQAALDDLQAVPAGGGQAPAWVDAIRAYCAFEPDQLAAARELPGNSQLVPYLEHLTYEWSRNPQVLLKATSALLEAHGDCDRASERASCIPGLDIRRVASSQALRWFARRLYPRLAAVPGLPAKVKPLVDARPDGSESPEAGEEGDPIELAARLEVLGALHEAGAASTADPGLSWQVLELMIRDTQFSQAWWKVDFEENWLSVPSEETRQVLRPLYEGHPYKLLIDSFERDPRKSFEIVQQLDKSVVDGDYELTHTLVDARITKVLGSSARNRHYPAATRHQDDVFRDQAQFTTGSEPSMSGYLATQALQRLSPQQPATVVAVARNNWKSPELAVPVREERYDRCDDVQEALAQMYQNLERPEDAERCLVRLVEMAPTYNAYARLAHVQKMQEKFDEWQASLEKALELPAIGLEHASIENELAWHFMYRLEWERALPHALAAAESYSGWGLQCAGFCYEGLQTWEKSEPYFQAAAERYPGLAEVGWYLWCRRTGHGNIDEARRLAVAYLAPRQDIPTGESVQQLAVLQVLDEQPAEALATIMARWKERWQVKTKPEVLQEIAYQGLLLADELGKTEERDAFLKDLAESMSGDSEPIHHRWHMLLARLFRPVLEQRDIAAWDSRRFEDLLLETEPGEVTNVYYYAGKFLALRGATELSQAYLQMAATSAMRTNMTCVLATCALRKAGIDVGSTRGGELDKSRRRLASAVRKGNFERARNLIERAITAYTRAVELEPDCRPALLGRAAAHEELKNYDAALADCDTVLQAFPKESKARKLRIKLLKNQQDFGAAITDYQGLLIDVPDWADGHRELAWLLATCSDPALRNAPLALEHAQRAAKLGKAPLGKNELTLAAAYAESEQFDLAVEHVNEALRQGAGSQDHAEISRQLELYGQKKKYEPPPPRGPAAPKNSSREKQSTRADSP